MAKKKWFLLIGLFCLPKFLVKSTTLEWDVINNFLHLTDINSFYGFRCYVQFDLARRDIECLVSLKYLYCFCKLIIWSKDLFRSLHCSQKEEFGSEAYILPICGLLA